MSLYLVAGHGAPTDVRVSGAHLPAARARRYPSDTTDAEWQALAACAAVGITVWRCTKSKHNGRTLPASGTLAAGAGSGRDMCEDNDALFAEIGTRGEKGMDGRHHDGQPVRRSAEPGNVRGANIAKREVCEIARQYVMSTRMQRAVRQKQPDFAVPVSTRPQRLALSAEPVDLQLTVTVTPGLARPGRLHPCPRRASRRARRGRRPAAAGNSQLAGVLGGVAKLRWLSGMGGGFVLGPCSDQHP
jgi:hypothetical protein